MIEIKVGMFLVLHALVILAAIPPAVILAQAVKALIGGDE